MISVEETFAMIQAVAEGAGWNARFESLPDAHGVVAYRMSLFPKGDAPPPPPPVEMVNPAAVNLPSSPPRVLHQDLSELTLVAPSFAAILDSEKGEEIAEATLGFIAHVVDAFAELRKTLDAAIVKPC